MSDPCKKAFEAHHGVKLLQSNFNDDFWGPKWEDWQAAWNAALEHERSEVARLQRAADNYAKAMEMIHRNRIISEAEASVRLDNDPDCGTHPVKEDG